MCELYLHTLCVESFLWPYSRSAALCGVSLGSPVSNLQLSSRKCSAWYQSIVSTEALSVPQRCLSVCVLCLDALFVDSSLYTLVEIAQSQLCMIAVSAVHSIESLSVY